MGSPEVSVILPVRNEADHLGSCLDAILAQDYPAADLEILVVDGASEDGTADVVQRYARNDSRVRLASNPQRIVPTSMNVGIREARGEIIVRVDGHTKIAEDYVRTGVEALDRTGAENVGGPMSSVGGGWFGDAVAAATSSRFGVGSYFHFGTTEREVDTVYMGMWRRAVFEQVGLFDEELVRNQDDELNYRIRKAAGRIVLVPTMRSAYQNRRTVVGLARQYFQYGLWKVRVLQKHPRQMSWRHFVPPSFVAGLGVATAISPWVPAAQTAAMVVTALYAVLVLVLARSQNAGWLATALAFATLHVSWGLGFLCGLVKFLDRWWKPESKPPALRITGGMDPLRVQRGGHR